MSTAIIVAGMHRSGTSAATGALQIAGVSLGEVLEPASDNRKGFFENRRAVDIHEKLLRGLGRSWDDVRALPEDWLSSEAARVARGEIEALIDEEFQDASLWAVKDPRICRFIPLWRGILGARGIPNVAILVVRHPEEVASSIRKRNGWGLPLGRMLWMRHVVEAEAYTRDVPRTVISYERLLADPVAVIERSLRDLGLSSAGEIQNAENISEFISSEDRHHFKPESGSTPDVYAQALEELYEALKAIEGPADDWRGVHAAAERAVELSADVLAYVEPVAAQAFSRLDSAMGFEVAYFDAKSKLNAQIEWSEQAAARLDELRSTVSSIGHSNSQTMGAVLDGIKDVSSTLQSAAQELLDQRRAWDVLGAEQVSRLGGLATSHEASIASIAGIGNKLAATLSDVQEGLGARQVELTQLLGEYRQILSTLHSREREEWGEERRALAAERALLLGKLDAERSRLEARQIEMERTIETVSAEYRHTVDVCEGLRNEVDAVSAELSQVYSTNESLRSELVTRSAQLQAIKDSTSWRAMAPLRAISGFFASTGRKSRE